MARRTAPSTAFPPKPLLRGKTAGVLRRVAVGQEVAVAAEAAGMAPADVEVMLADGRMAHVLATYRDLLILPDPMRLHMLRNLCFEVILEAVEEREPRVCIWYFHETQRGRDPFEVLALSVERMLKRTPPAEPVDRPPPPPIDPDAYDPFSEGYPNRARLRVLARLRLRVIEELAARRTALLQSLGHDPSRPAPASLDWVAGLRVPPLPDAPARAPVPEPRAGP